MSAPTPDAREVARVEVLATVVDADRADAFLDRCLVGTTWNARIRTAEVVATVLDRVPLGSFDEHICTCLRLRLSRPVPVEPRLRFEIAAADDPSLKAMCLVRPWKG